MTSGSNSGGGTYRAFLKVLKYILIIIVVYFAGKKLVTSWNEVITYDWVLNPYLLVLAILTHLLTFLLLAQVWCFLISGFGYRINLRTAFKISYIANLGRYIPGKVWQVFGMVYLAKKVNIKEEAAAASWGLAQMFAIPAAFLVGLVAIVWHPELLATEISRFVGTGLYVAILIVFVVSLLMIVAPNRTLLLFNVILKIFKRPPVTFQISKVTALKVYVGYFIAWAVFGLSFWLFARSIAGVIEFPVVAGIGAFVVSYQIGYLTVFSPGGLGVRELVLTSVMTAYLGPVAAGLAVASRLWNMISEIIAAIIALRIKLRT
ncbi:MAG: lysylphosphatidylglycerol synthase transmembrane domain-containing protein [Candidatus Zixiibacteriota bacterium]